ncbi:hypothetical protein CVU76_01125 [Candidatus Dojkabacteria bacterium HGW-Dojkabacteria-1]|uniref:Uncharacterized protein n=1 Tax=Candidatus Dojkabacteria bacterium HGW-Dojkabacteria-1 TaxID=2013761 RepID=A0A2N2F327_9BACT|nr:MAG: hypothetical protein CVU76_01125 [Candidatus Dojkabacteria bacterium HGW-Dojkabacteria-1]
MEEVLKKQMEIKEKDRKYDYTSLESQLLLQETTQIIAEVTKYCRDLEWKITSLEMELEKHGRIRFMVKKIFSKLFTSLKINILKLVGK